MQELSRKEALVQRLNVNVWGDGPIAILMVHGWGCNQDIWRRVAAGLVHLPARLVFYDLMGCGDSDPSQFELSKYRTLDGHARDLVELAAAFGNGGPCVVLGHSVGGMIGMLAANKAPELFDAHAMLSPSPCFIDQGDYHGGFPASAIEGLLTSMEAEPSTWAESIAGMVLGAGAAPELVQELAASFCRMQPQALLPFARATFASDLRQQLAHLEGPTLVVQCTDDALAPLSVGEYMQQQIPQAELLLLETEGHCPHLTVPNRCSEAISAFVRRELPGVAA